MKRLSIVIVIPFYNEAKHISDCLDSFVNQQRQPDQLLLVNDGSIDDSPSIVKTYAQTHSWITLLHNDAAQKHMPGKKVIQAFWAGANKTIPFDIIGKFDADIVLPPNYFTTLEQAFLENPKLGMASGLLYTLQNGGWKYEAIAEKTHIRGPIKLYSKECFDTIGGPRPAIGWDTLDTLLARYHKFNTKTFSELQVKHLRPTGGAYTQKARLLQGHAMYTLGYGFWITAIASGKTAWKQKRFQSFADNMSGFLQAKKNRTPLLVSQQEARFIRHLRWQGIFKKLGF